ncbi:MAG TPA: hypothetical protein VFC24_00610, partial [Casimicrobiaceae bacterium]|nr:hypothetical protein [Casimicrobiaceae bacterium]
MRFGITTKLFVAILLTNVTIAVAFAVANQVSVDRGFREYVREREQRRLEFLAEDLAMLYVSQGRTWDSLRNNDTQWRRMTRQDRSFGPRPLPTSVNAPVAAHPPHPHLAPPLRGALPPWSFQLSLLDDRRAPVAGPAIAMRDEVLWQPIRVDGAEVGWIAAHAADFAGPDMQFLQQQLRTSWIILAVAVVLAALAA